MSTVKPVGYIQMNDKNYSFRLHAEFAVFGALAAGEHDVYLAPAPQTPALAVERASKLLLLYEMQLTTLQPPLRERVAAMIEAMKGMGL